MSKNYSYFSHKECEYFPCHKGADVNNFNCLFCYCPLYALGDKCGRGYNIKSLKPKVEGICDYCGGDLYQRKDDTKETIEERLVVYNNKTKPIITYYESLGILVPVNSNQEPSKVIDEIINKVN